MQVGFSPVNIKSPTMNSLQRQQTTNFGANINVKASITKPIHLQSMLKTGDYDDNPTNRKLLGEALDGMSKHHDSKFNIPFVKKSVTEHWNVDKALKELLDKF